MSAAQYTMEIATAHGPARAHVDRGGDAGTLVLGHGAGGGVSAPDLVAACGVAHELGLRTVLVEQPYRVAGRRSAPRPPVLDAAWLAVIEALRDGGTLVGPLICGGRSSGARVACRTATSAGAAAVLCLAFPLQPPGVRRDGTQAPDRRDELDGAGVPVLVVQGQNDRFGLPEAGPSRSVVVIRGDHGLKSDVTGLRQAVGAWLGEQITR
jgi:uncharacterized protein